MACRDKLMGFSIASEVACILTGLSIMMIFRFVRLPLLEVCRCQTCHDV